MPVPGERGRAQVQLADSRIGWVAERYLYQFGGDIRMEFVLKEEWRLASFIGGD